MKTPRSLSSIELRAELESKTPLVLVDVREPSEWAICRIVGSRSIPLGELPARIAELDPTVPTVCICHHGVRSAHAAAALARAGFEDPINLSGGIDAWARWVDTGMRRY